VQFNEKQIEIIQVAEKLFAQEGFDGVSVREIAKASGVNVAMISYYFGSKEKLLGAIVWFRINALNLHLESINKGKFSPLEKIDKLIELYVERVNKNIKIHQILHFELNNPKRSIDFSSFTEGKKQNLKVLETIIEEGKQQGVFRADVVPALVITTVIGSVLHFYSSKIYYKEIMHFKTDAQLQNFFNTTFIHQIKNTIKGLLTYEM